VVNRITANTNCVGEAGQSCRPTASRTRTREIGGIVEFIAALVAKNAAYETGDGVYFSVETLRTIPTESSRSRRTARRRARRKARAKKGAARLCAVKKAKPGEPSWPSPWGPGRPGWHNRMLRDGATLLGDQFDIHGGATDLIFPHHENEVAQTESVTGKHPMARYWIHAGLLMVDGQKMSKSLGNFVPMTTLLERHVPAAIPLSLPANRLSKAQNLPKSQLARRPRSCDGSTKTSSTARGDRSNAVGRRQHRRR